MFDGGCDLAIAFVLRQTPAPWPRAQGLQAHQSHHPVQIRRRLPASLARHGVRRKSGRLQ
jgi:hypothetical protein